MSYLLSHAVYLLSSSLNALVYTACADILIVNNILANNLCSQGQHIHGHYILLLTAMSSGRYSLL